MEISKTMRILTVYHLFRNCAEVELVEITGSIPVSQKTVQRDIHFLRQAGLIRARWDKEAQAYIPQSAADAAPAFPENKTQRRYMERIIRLCAIMDDFWELENGANPIAWYRARYPALSDRTRQRDYALLNALGYEMWYEPGSCGEPGRWVCQTPDTYSLTTL